MTDDTYVWRNWEKTIQDKSCFDCRHADYYNDNVDYLRPKCRLGRDMSMSRELQSDCPICFDFDPRLACSIATPHADLADMALLELVRLSIEEQDEQAGGHAP